MTRFVTALVLALIADSAASANGPEPVPPIFVSDTHGLTFSPPKGSTYCPLPSDWVGSDHGTIIFLEPPRTCGGAGYPSSSRGFQPFNTPRIEVYYSYWDAEDAPAPPSCNPVGDAELFGHDQPVCSARTGALVEKTVRATYMADSESHVVITLVTTANRLQRDTIVFQDMVKTIQTCSSDFRTNNGKSFTVGIGRTCPKDGRYF